MHKPKTTRLRWDRIGAVAGVLVLASWGIAAVVPESGSNEEMETEGRVSVMNAPVEVEVTSVELAPVASVRPEVSVPEVQESLVKPAPSGPLPRNGIAPCSCSKYTMKLARNPYTQHQKRARTLPGSFYIKSKASLAAGAERGDLERIPEVGRGYHLSGLSHSEPFLLPAARRRRNANAFMGKSSHSYGASFDGAFIDRPNESVTCPGPTWAMQTILKDMQNEGKILIIPEGNCMHITPR